MSVLKEWQGYFNLLAASTSNISSQRPNPRKGNINIKIGGNRNIRGYRDEQFLASRLAYGTFEPRYSLSRKSYLFGFFDLGYYYRDEDAKNKIPLQQGFLYGYGVGLQIETGIGIVGIHYAINKDAGLLDGNIFFGLINNF